MLRAFDPKEPMPNYLKMPKKQQVLALLDLGWSYRRIQRETGVRRETVSEYDLQRHGWPVFKRSSVAAFQRSVTHRQRHRRRAVMRTGRTCCTVCATSEASGTRGDEAAQQCRVPRRKLERALRLMEMSGELAEAVLRGTVPLALAERSAERPINSGRGPLRSRPLPVEAAC